MLSYITRFGLYLGIMLLNVGMLLWLFDAGERGIGRGKIVKDIISSSLLLIILALALYLR